jgi:signal transduction histidine kinase
MPLGGTLTIRTEYAELAADLNELPTGRYVSICVEDTGFGMCSETLTRVFDPFYTTKATGHRMGWGLPLTALFVEQSRGHLAIDSAPGAGTQVWLHLPSNEI